jgi:hypothetical protein
MANHTSKGGLAPNNHLLNIRLFLPLTAKTGIGVRIFLHTLNLELYPVK